MFRCSAGSTSGGTRRCRWPNSEKCTKVSVPIIIRSPEQLALALANSPFGDDDAEPKWRFIAFLSATPQQTGVDGEVFAPDIFTVAGDHVHVLLPSGSAKSKLTTNYLEKVLGVEATLRNHNTVSKIVGLC